MLKPKSLKTGSVLEKMKMRISTISKGRMGLKYLSMLICPISLFVWTFYLRSIKGPYYFMQDPDYAYLLNSLNIINHYPPAHVDHPGTVLHLLGALILKTICFLTAQDNITHDVLARPEYYLVVISISLSVMVCLALFWGGLVVFRATGSIVLTFMFQSSLFLSPTLLVSLVRVEPEPLLICICIVFCALLIRADVCCDAQNRNLLYAILFAILSGCGMATKITFLPMLLIPFIMLPGLMSKLLYSIGTVVSFVMFTLPIHNQYPYMWSWIKSIVFHLGRYGHGDSGIIQLPVFIKNIIQIAMSEYLFISILTIGVIFIFTMVMINGKGFLQEYRLKLLIALLFAQIIQIVMMAKHPGNNRYLIPSLALCGPILVVLYLHCKEVGIKSLRRVARIIIITISLVTIYSLYDFNFYQYYKNNMKASDRFGALYHFADYWAGKHYAPMIKELYKNR